MTPTTISLTAQERALIIEALEMRASRHESMSRFNTRVSKPHDEKAAAMRRLRERLLKLEGVR
jgi:hypothetical protein